ncbi:N-acetylmuramoyl-L-alanine amidase [Candidatus Woesearchaeota archaeon]|nr:N-acetylmuramoyl-L-alanine amidase [Candidatus Woesearchaeota archaeon]
MQKRGQYNIIEILIIPVIGLVLVFGFFFTPLLAETLKIQETTFFEKHYLVRDMAMIVDVLYAAPGNMAVVYDKDTKTFSFKFSPKEAIVYDATSDLKLETSYRIIGSRLISLEPAELMPEFTPKETTTKEAMTRKSIPVFAKLSNRIIIKDQEGMGSLTLLELPCSPGKPAELKKIAIDAGHGGELTDKSADDGYTSPAAKEKDLTASAATYLINSFQGKMDFAYSRADTTSDATLQKRSTSSQIEKDFGGSDIILSLHIGNKPGNSNTVKAFYYATAAEDIQAQSKAIACRVLNRIAQEDIGITGISLAPIEPKQYHDEEFLDEKKPGFILELGSIQSAATMSMLQDISKLGLLTQGIARGLGLS